MLNQEKHNILSRTVAVVLSVLWSIQLTVVLSLFLKNHKPSSILSQSVVDQWRYLLRPEYDSTVYHIVLLFAVIACAVIYLVLKRITNFAYELKLLRKLMICEGVLTTIMCGALFKILMYPQQPQMATGLLILLAVLSLILKFTYRFVMSSWDGWMSFVNDHRMSQLVALIAPWLMSGAIIIAIYIPDIDGIVARTFIGEQLHHNDSYIMAPVLAMSQGQKLNVDVISQYGIGFVAIVTFFVNALASFDYAFVMRIMVIATIVYYLGWYWLCRRMIKDNLVLTGLFALMLKWQLFHPGTYPLVFTYGSQTPMRFLFDVIVFWLLFLFWQHPSKGLLYLCASSIGFGIYYCTSEGIYAAGAFMVMLGLIASFSRLRDYTKCRWSTLLISFLIIPIVVVFLIWLTVGHDMFTLNFWKNTTEFITYFTSGFGLEPMGKTLVAKQFLTSITSFIIPCVYLFTLLTISAWVMCGKISPVHMWISLLCVYGLGTYHYYIARSVTTSFYTVSIPYAIVLGFWVKYVIDHMPLMVQIYARWIFCIVCVGSLITTHQWMSYPNFLNVSRNPLTDPAVIKRLPDGKPYFNHLFRDFDPSLPSEESFASDDELIAYYKNAIDFKVDARMIQQLTNPQEEVALISSFEVELLRQAHRKTFFYYFPLVISRPLSLPTVPAISIYTQTQMKKTLDKIERVKPKFVFVENVLVSATFNADMMARYPSTVILLEAINAQYQPYVKGKYVTALKRKVP